MSRDREEIRSSAIRKNAVDLSWPAIFRQYAAFALLGLGIVGGAVYFVYQRIDDELRSRLERTLQEHYGPRGFQVRVRSVEWQEGVGFEIHDLTILDPQTRPMEMFHVEEMRIPCDRGLQDLLTEEWSPSQIVLKRPKFSLVAREGDVPRAFELFPLPPLRPGGFYPTVTVEMGEVAWVDPDRPTERLFESRQIFGTFTPTASPTLASSDGVAVHAPTRFAVHLIARADRMERLELIGSTTEDGSDWSVTADIHRLRATPELIALAAEAGIPVPDSLPRFRGETSLRIVCKRRDATAPIAAPITSTNANDFVRLASFDTSDAIGGTTSDLLARLPCEVAVAGTFADFDVADDRLPFPVTQAQGAFAFDSQGLTVSRAAGRVGPGTFWMSGSVRDPLGRPSVVAKVKLRDVWLDESLARRVPATWRESFGRFSPVGTVHADLDVAQRDGVWTGDAVVEAAGVTISPREFPYPITGTTGVIRWKGGTLDVRLAGNAAGQTVRLAGVVNDPLASGPGRIEISADRPIPIDERLVNAAAAAAPEAADFLRALQLQGLIAVEGELVREKRGEPIEMRLVVTLTDGSFRHREFPYPMDDVQGKFRLENGRWSFERVGGRYGTAFVLVDGSLETDPRVGRRLILKAVATDVPIDESLFQALRGTAQSTCRQMQLRGTLDQAAIEWSHDFDRDASDFAFHAWKWRLPDDRTLGGAISFQPGCFPYLFENVTGELVYRDGRLSLTGLRAAHGEENWQADLSYAANAEGGWRFAMENLIVDRLQLHDQLRQALPVEAARPLGENQIDGTFAVRGALRVEQPTDRDPVATDWDVAVDIENGSIGSTIPMRHVHGEVRLAGRQDDSGFRSRGEIRIDSAMCRDLQVTNLQGPIAIDERQALFGAWAEPRLIDRAPRSIVGTLFGGELQSDAQMSFEDGSFVVQSRLNDANLTSLAQNAASGYQEISGKLHGLLNLKGSSEGTHTLRGSGFLRLRDARIYEAPLVTSLLRSLPGKSPETPLFQTTDVDFRIQGSHVYLDRCNFHGDAVTLKGQGEIGFDRRISLDFYAVAGKDKVQVPILTSALGLASRQILQIHVDGTLDEPVIENKPLPVLKETLDQVFPEAKADPEVAKLPGPLNWLREAARY